MDYETKTLTFSEEELYRSVSKVLERDREYAPRLDDEYGQVFGGGPLSMPPLDGPGWELNWWSDGREFKLSEDAGFLPLRNVEGGMSAYATSYIAINRNTPYPDEAFHIADVMMSRKFQKGEIFWPSDSMKMFSNSISVFSWATGIPVYDDMLEGEQKFNYEYDIAEEAYPAYCEIRDQITDARIKSSVDQVLDELCAKALYDRYYEELKTEEDLKKRVSEAYIKMVLMVGEL
ncbi:MAG: hypothetical protein J1E06_08165 [Acutalibacter sp.]|nr:hypothetical protein [Acutalibacter sp.]